MNQSQLDQIVEEVKQEFFPEGQSYSDSYYAKLMRSSSDGSLNDYFLFSSVMQNTLLDSYIAINNWAKTQDSSDFVSSSFPGGLEPTKTYDAIIAMSSEVSPQSLRYVNLGFRRGKATELHTIQRKDADQAWENLVSAQPWPEEALLSASYPLLELWEQVITAGMVQSVHHAIHYGEMKGSPWAAFCGGLCYGLHASSVSGWIFGHRVAEVVLIAEEMLNLEGEVNGQEGEANELPEG